MPRDEQVLEVAETYLRERVAPRAEEIDSDVSALREALDGLCRLELMALRRPEAYGGPGVSEETFRRFQEEVARRSGTLAFLQTQHQSAASMIARSDNEELKSEYLPAMGDGGRLVGIGFSQLRRSGPPVMRATPLETGGYRLEGSVPWVTGWSLYPEFLLGATLPDGRALFAVLPLPTQPIEGMRVSQPMRLAAMEAAMTVSVEFGGYEIDESRVVFVRPPSWIRNNDQINIALQGHFAIGCACAGLDILAAQADSRELDFLREAHTGLSDEVERCREATRTAQQDLSEETTQERLEVRAWAIDLAVRCAHAAIVASSGAANSMRHPAQRVYREALVFTVSAQTPAIMEATLRRLVRPKG
jgi:alkylation response protein AidB-like acyl-CoA dehydrogenase